MANKVTTSIYLEENTFRNAKQLGLNISRVSENALLDLLNRIDGKGGKVVSPSGIEPETTGLKARCFRRSYSILAELRAPSCLHNLAALLFFKFTSVMLLLGN